ncbi:penicillin-binding transpeptidase domain-containing protein [Paenibacillus sp. N1-5-1-14]|uniref:penicillin-binding transpeptidase domain-containing protein n=1 Tax=Paenibacillus radicibacter TaxID=2972488 RepID=UPI002158E3AE|nr:penicillin-binding transpeptidase domain-containing protein [Paenibacillus radicibacter]MCR8641923.1 penicillin-binding transpeptidase domain-containing protein [Paenibacillus radicibacter]
MIKKTRIRTLLIGGLFTLLFLCLAGRMYWIQVVQASDWQQKAEEKWNENQILKPDRGAIVDRNGKVLAEDVPAYTISVNPKLIDQNGHGDAIVKGLTSILKDPNDSGAELESRIRTAVSKKKEDGTFLQNVPIKEGSRLSREKRDEVQNLITELQKKQKRKLDNTGIDITEEKKRYYPGGTLAAHVIGYTNKEDQPVQGLEKLMKDTLIGVPGHLKTQTDGKGVEFMNAKVDLKPAVNGKTVRTTIDQNIQFYMENALSKMYDKWQPKSISAVAADPKTMEILGMASYPNFNPNEYSKVKNIGDLNNITVSDQYEPGSTYKIVTLAGAIEEGVFNPEDKFQSGSIQVQGKPVFDWNRVGWGRITYLDGLEYSSNVAFVKLGTEKMTHDKLKDYMLKFGFGVKTNIDLPSEVSGSLPMKYPSDFARSTFGQGVSVNTVQQVAAFAAIANGGNLMKPHVVKDILDSKTGEVLQSFQPEVIRRVVSEATAKKTSGYLENVVTGKHGTGKTAAMEGFRVAGKTGTANKVIEGKRGYAENVWITSFCGYVPIEDPQVVMCVIADEAVKDYHQAKEVAPVAFKEIMTQTMKYLGVNSSKTVIKMDKSEPLQFKAPDLSNMTFAEAKEAVKNSGIVLEQFGQGDKIVTQFPRPGMDIRESEHMYVAMQSTNTISVPDLAGKSLREAMEITSFLGINIKVTGEGYVASQRLDGEGSVQTLVLELMTQEELKNRPSPSPSPPPTNKENKPKSKK